jgi:hypothetical protein
MIRAPQQRRKNATRVLMIFNDKDVHCSTLAGPSKQSVNTALSPETDQAGDLDAGCAFDAAFFARLVAVPEANREKDAFSADRHPVGLRLRVH